MADSLCNYLPLSVYCILQKQMKILYPAGRGGMCVRWIGFNHLIFIVDYSNGIILAVGRKVKTEFTL